MVEDFRDKVTNLNPEVLNFNELQTLQVNLGNMCNQYCMHCHIDAGPSGNKIMRKDVMGKIIDFLKNRKGLVLDITGGCPELNPDFKFFIKSAQPLVSKIMVRTNLTIFFEKGMEWIPEWYSDHGVVIVASLPCYTKDNVDNQRGNGVFEDSILLKKTKSPNCRFSLLT